MTTDNIAEKVAEIIRDTVTVDIHFDLCDVDRAAEAVAVLFAEETKPLWEALKPFAAAAGSLYPDGFALPDHLDGFISIGDLRRARQALKEEGR